MPGYIQNIAQFNPVVVAEHLLRSTIIFKVELVALFTEQYAQVKLPAIFVMIAYALIMAIILLVSNEMIKRAAIQRKTMPKKAKKGAVDMEKAELGAYPIERIETLIKTAGERRNKLLSDLGDEAKELVLIRQVGRESLAAEASSEPLARAEFLFLRHIGPIEFVVRVRIEEAVCKDGWRHASRLAEHPLDPIHRPYVAASLERVLA
jgi:hypothetical protein